MDEKGQANITPQEPEDINVLKAQLTALRQEMNELKTTNMAFWALLFDISKKMQVSSTVIKASVSSLLGTDIIFDGSTQNEILEIIDSSTNQVSNQVKLLTIISMIEANKLSLNAEPIGIQEILSFVISNISKNNPEHIPFELSVCERGLPVLVDYEYFSIALVFLLEIILETEQGSQKLTINTNELNSHQYVDILGISNHGISTLVEALGQKMRS